MKKVLTFGVFDYFHIGHLNLLEQAKKHGDILIVAVQNDDYVCKFKPDANPFYTIQDRTRLLQALKIVDMVITYNDVYNNIKTIDFDVMAVGEDQNSAIFMNAIQWCLEHGKEVVHLHRTTGISSSGLKKKIAGLE